MNVTALYRDVLAEQLGIAPKERVTLSITQDSPAIVLVSCLVDGGDLTAAQEVIFRRFVERHGIKVFATHAEKPVQS